MACKRSCLRLRQGLWNGNVLSVVPKKATCATAENVKCDKFAVLKLAALKQGVPIHTNPMILRNATVRSDGELLGSALCSVIAGSIPFVTGRFLSARSLFAPTNAHP